MGTTTPASQWSVTQAYGSVYYYTYIGYSGSPSAMSWAYTSSNGKVDTSTPFYKECTSDVGKSPGSGKFQKVLFLNESAVQQQNYANWYSYYRTRTLLMRTAVGRAFAALDSGYRVGFSTINSSTDATTSDGFQPLADFDASQKSALYTKLYGAAADSSTPLRGALSKIGRYYANAPLGQTADPVQYACQRNFVLLSTDGYWNKGYGSSLEGSSYGPLDLAGNNVGNQDSTEARPMYDGGTPTTTYSRTAYVVSTAGQYGCSRREYKVRTTDQTSDDNSTWSPTSPSNPSDNRGTCRAGNYVLPSTSPAQTAGANAGKTVYSAVTATPVISGGSSDTLADVAEYYYKTDLRDGNNCTSTSSGTTQNVCSNVVPTSGRDTAKHQHMTTFTIGLGVSGTLTYDRDYLTKTTGAYADLSNPNSGVNWPVPSTTINTGSGDARNIDDLWHAAVNGRGPAQPSW